VKHKKLAQKAGLWDYREQAFESVGNLRNEGNS